MQQPLSDLLKDPTCLRPYNLIILCAPIPRQERRIVCEYAQQKSISILHIQSTGFYSSFSVQLPQIFPIVDTHPDPDSTQDLRLLLPWPELAAEVSALGDLDKLEDLDHGHVPYILILLYYLEKWKQKNDGKAPNTFKEKTQFRDMVKAAARTDTAEGGEENFDEAAGAVLKSIAPFSLKGDCKDMFVNEACKDVTTASANFWIIASAIKSFYETHHVLPLPGSLPDMKAKSADYIKLQTIYKNKAKKDVAEVKQSVRATEKALARQPPIPEIEIETFCKKAAHVKVLHGSLLPQLRLQDRDPQTRKRVLTELENDASLLSIMLAFEHTGSPSSSSSSSSSPPQPHLSDDLLANNTSIDREAMGKVFTEVARLAGHELHNISSLTGGLVAQEAIKILTRQYVPVDNTCVFDGIRGATLVLRL
jgi:NEDD8-activating enzyme E1 regulatory subunit